MGSFLIGLIGQIASLLTGTIGGALTMISGLVKTGYSQMLQYNQEGVALARQMGLNAREAQAYTTTLIERADTLAAKYGLAAEQVMELQKNITNATGKQFMLNDAQAESLVQINKLVGSDVFNQFASEMMNGMGAQFSTIQGAVSKAYITAAKNGLNAQKMSQKIAQNLSMANRLSFRNGVNGLTKMAMYAEKVGLNMKSVESAASNFMDFDKAIENSAQMQMLGGSAAVNFGNPLTAMYEANYDPEAFAKRLSDSLASYATFDAKTGMSNVNGMNMDFVRNIAKVMGISTEEAVSNAKKQAEVKYKEGAFGRALGNFGTEEQRNFILNKSYVENGRLMINDVNGKQYDISSGTLPTKILQEMMKYDNMSDRDIMEQNAAKITSIDETIKGYETSFFAKIAGAIQRYEGYIKDIIHHIGTLANNEVAKNIASIVGDVGHWLVGHIDDIKDIATIAFETIGGTLKFFRDNWSWLKWVLGAILLAVAVDKVGTWIAKTQVAGQALKQGGWKNFVPGFHGYNKVNSTGASGGASGAAMAANTASNGASGAAAITPKPVSQLKLKDTEVVSKGGRTYSRNSSNGVWTDVKSGKQVGSNESLNTALNKKRKNLLNENEKIMRKNAPISSPNTANTAAKGGKISNAFSKIAKPLKGVGRGILKSGGFLLRGLRGVGGILLAAGPFLLDGIKAMGPFFKGAGEFILKGVSGIGGLFAKAGGLILDGAKGLVTVFTSIGKTLLGSIQGLSKTISTTASSLIGKTKNVVKPSIAKPASASNAAKGGKASKALTYIKEKGGKTTKYIVNTTRNIASRATPAVNTALKWVGRGVKSVAKGAGGAVGISAIMAGIDMNQYRETMSKLTEELKNGRITQEQYNEQVKAAKQSKNEGLGAGVGAIAGSFLDPFIGPFGTILGTIVGGAVGNFWNSIYETVSNFWNGTVRDIVGNIFGDVGTSVVDGISETFDGLTTGFGTLLEGLFGGVGTFLSGLWDGVKTIFTGWFDGVTKIFQGDLSGFLDILTSTFKGSWDMIKGTVVGAWEIVIAPIKGAWEGWKGMFNGLEKIFPETSEWFKGAWGSVVNAFSSMGDWFVDIWDGIKERWNGVFDWFGGVWDSVGNYFKGIFQRIWDGLSDEAKDKIRGAVSKVTGFFTGIWDGIKNKWNGVITKIGDVWNGITNKWNNAVTFVKNKFDGAVQFFSDVWQGASDAWNGVTEWFGGVWNGAIERITSVWDGIVGVISPVFDVISSTTQKVFNGIKDVFAPVADFVREKIVEPFTALKDKVIENLSPVFEFFGTIKNYAVKIWDTISNLSWSDVLQFIKDGAKSALKSAGDFVADTASSSINYMLTGKAHAEGGIIGASAEKHDIGGVIGGSSTSGDHIIAPFVQGGQINVAGLNSGEMVLNASQQAALFNFIKKLTNGGNVITRTDNAYSNVTSYRAANYDAQSLLQRVINQSNATNNGYLSNVTSYKAVNNDVNSVVNSTNSVVSALLDSSSMLNTNINSLANILSNFVNNSITSTNNVLNGIWKNSTNLYGTSTANNTLLTNVSNRTLNNSSDVLNAYGSSINNLNNTYTGFRSVVSNIISSLFGGSSSDTNSIFSNAYNSSPNTFNSTNSYGYNVNNLNRTTNGFTSVVSNIIPSLFGDSTTTTTTNNMPNSMYNSISSYGYNVNNLNRTTNGFTSVISNIISSLFGDSTTNNMPNSMYNSISSYGGNINSLSSTYNGFTSVVSNIISSLFGGSTTNNNNSALNSGSQVSNIISSLFGGSTTNNNNSALNSGSQNTISGIVSNLLNDSTVNTNSSNLFNKTSVNANDIVNESAVSTMMTSMVTSVLTNRNDVTAKPVGEKEYIYTPSKNEMFSSNNNTMTVKDFNINLGGTIKLDGGNNSKNVDVNSLLNDFSFVNALKEMIKQSINHDMNFGRFMNDLSVQRGHVSSFSLFG